MEFALVCVCSLLVIFSFGLIAQETLNNETIVKLVKAGISEDTIVSMVSFPFLLAAGMAASVLSASMGAGAVLRVWAEKPVSGRCGEATMTGLRSAGE